MSATITVLVLAGVISRTPGTDRAVPIRSSSDPVQTTMTLMRLAATLIDDHARRFGTYPSPDGALRPLRAALSQDATPPAGGFPLDDAWGRPLLYRAVAHSYGLVSLGADGAPEQDYGTLGIYPEPQLLQIVDAPDPRNDLVMVRGRFLRRPFGTARASMETVNAITRIAQALMSYSIDNNQYPATGPTLQPVSQLADELVPVYLNELPTTDGWGHPIVYASSGANFVLGSFGSNGVPDGFYYTDLAGGVPWNDEGPSEAIGADLFFANGHFVTYPAGVEP